MTIVMPQKGVPTGLRSTVRSDLPTPPVNFLDVPRLTGSRRRVVDSLYEVLGLVHDAGDRVRVDDFIAHPDLDRRLIWVDCRAASPEQAEAWGTFLKHYSAAAVTVPAFQRTVFSTVCTGAQAASMPDTDRLVSKRWWWRALGPLDTAVFVSEMLAGEARVPGFAEVVTEVAGFDLGVAAMLVEEWDGDAGCLAGLLAEYDSDLADGGTLVAMQPSPASRPRPELVAAWSRGLVNAWGDHDPHHHPCYRCSADPDAVSHLVWRGQVRSLMPRIEIERQRLAAWVYQRRDRLPSEWANQDILGLEVGGLSTLFSAVPELVGRERRIADRAHWLRWARNKIAHLEILDRSGLERAKQIFDPEEA